MDLSTSKVMKRVFLDKIEGEKAFLDDAELHHLVRVLRSQEGDPFYGIDSHGRICQCILRMEEGEWFGEIVSVEAKREEETLHLTLAQALVKKDKFEWVIQKAVELGVCRIIPIVTERTEIQLKGEREARKVKRWRRIVGEAVKQCRRSSVPDLLEPVLLQDLPEIGLHGPLIVLDEAEGEGLKEFVEAQDNLSSCVVLVGPEGGWGDRDREWFLDQGVVSVNLGPRILRTETASVVAISILQYLAGDLGRSR